MIEVKLVSDINEDNLKLFNNGYDNSHKIFRCTQCGEQVSVDESYSNKGKDLICCNCVYKNAKKLDMTNGQWCNKYLWKE